MIMQAIKTQCKDINLWGICLHFLCIVTINHRRILNNKLWPQEAIDLKLNYHFFYSCIIFRRTNRAHWRSVIDSQLLMIKNKPSNSQGSKMTYIEHNFVFSSVFLHFPRFSYIKIVHSTEGNFIFGSSHCSWDHVANYSLKWVLKYGASALRLARKYKISFLC